MVTNLVYRLKTYAVHCIHVRSYFSTEQFKCSSAEILESNSVLLDRDRVLNITNLTPNEDDRGNVYALFNY